MNCPRVRDSVFLLCIFFSVCSYGQSEKPTVGQPESSDISFLDPFEFQYKIRVTLADGRELQGKLLLFESSMHVSCASDGDKEKKEFTVKSLKSIHIISWVPKKYGNDNYVFNPGEVLLKTDKGETFTCNAPRQIKKIRFITGKRQSMLYAYFYDSWKNGKWQNAGKSGFVYPITHPHRDTVKEILFED